MIPSILKTWVKDSSRAWKVSSFIIGIVFSNYIADYVIVGSLVDVFVDVLNVDLVSATIIINVKEGFASFIAIAGAFIAQAYVSRYFVVLISMALYIHGLVFLAVTIILKSHALGYIALVLIAVGEGGHENTLRRFGDDQFENKMEDKDRAKLHSTIWWYAGAFAGAVAGMVYVILIPIDKRDLAWKLQSICPPIVMVIAFYVAVMGTLSYYRDVPSGSPFTDVLHVLVACTRKRDLDYPADDTDQIHGGQDPGNELAICCVNGSNINMSPDSQPKGNNGHSLKRAVPMSDEGGHRYLRKLQTWVSMMERRTSSSHLVGLSRSLPISWRTPRESGPYKSLEENHLLQDHLQSGICDEDLTPFLDHNCEIEEVAQLSLREDDRRGHIPISLTNDDINPAKNEESNLHVEVHWLPHTNRLRWLDKAAIIDKSKAIEEESKWILCTQTQVEETKFFFRLFPIWATLLMYGMILSMGNTFFFMQASTLDASFDGNPEESRFRVPLTFLFAISGLSKVFLALAQTLLLQLNKLTHLKHGVSPRLRIGAGLFLSAVCCLIASLVEKKRLKVVQQNQGREIEYLPMTVFWLVPQFSVLGAMDELVQSGMEDLFMDQVPETMWSCETTFTDSVVGMGSMLSALTIFVVSKMSKLGGGSGWIHEDLGLSRLDHYYLMFVAAGLINLCVYAYVARSYPWTGNVRESAQEKLEEDS